jgi:hypothetical protein
MATVSRQSPDMHDAIEQIEDAIVKWVSGTFPSIETLVQLTDEQVAMLVEHWLIHTIRAIERKHIDDSSLREICYSVLLREVWHQKKVDLSLALPAVAYDNGYAYNITQYTEQYKQMFNRETLKPKQGD